jgi:hypothetical protein
MMLLIVSRGLSYVSASSSNSVSTLDSSCSAAIQQTYEDYLSASTAERNAVSSSLYSQGIESYYYPTFSSIFQIDRTVAPYPECTEQVESFNVVFFLHNSTGSVVDNLVITESQDLTVIGSSVQTDNPREFSSSGIMANYEGYDAYYTGGSSDYIYYSSTLYTQPTPGYVAYPATCYDTDCWVSTWTGIGNDPSYDASRFAQDGTSAYCDASNCSYGAGQGFEGWYALYYPGGGTTDCGSNVTIKGGDTIYAYTEDDYYGGGSDGYFTFEIDDETSSTSCLAGDISSGGYVTSPDYAYYMTEDPNACSGSMCTLAPFGTISWTDARFYDWNSQAMESLYTAYGNSDYVTESMENGAVVSGTCNVVDNIIISSTPSSGGDFSTEWQSSQYTPEDPTTNCVTYTT